ncbi:MAG: class I SAM-dependent methyltransferase [Anaerolineae bacterium]
MDTRVDFGLTASDYGRHRAGFPDSLFDRLSQWGIGRPEQQLVDLGTGTGTLARGFAQRGCRVTGVDTSAQMLAEAKRLDEQAGISVDYRVGGAENTGLPANCADVVTAGQCWHWFDRTAAAREVARILRPEGWLVIAHFDWLPLAGNVVQATEELILTHNPKWGMAHGNGMYPQWLTGLAEDGYRQLESFSYDLPVPYSHADWRGRIRASAGVGASLSPEQVEVFDAELGELLRARFPQPILEIPHRVFAVIAQV